MKLRHVGILVKDLQQAKTNYENIGFTQVQPVEHLFVCKMADDQGNMIELVQGNWKPHIAVNWCEDKEGNLIEFVQGDK